ncbi:GldL-related protein [Mesonia mobilis]
MGSLFKIMHWPFASTTLMVGYFLLAIVFVPSLVRYIYLKSQ